MTQSELKIRVKNNLDDFGVWYSDKDLDDSIQDGYDEIVIFSQCIEKRGDLQFRANKPYCQWPNEIPADFYSVIQIWNSSNNPFFAGTDTRYESGLDFKYETISVSEPTNYTVIGPDRIGFDSRNISGDSVFTLFYKARAPKLTSDSVLLINENYILLPELYSTADLLEQNQEYSKATIYWAQYDPMLEEYRSKIQKIARADKVLTRS